MKSSALRRAAIRIAEVVLNAKFLVPFAAVVVILGAVIIYVTREGMVLGLYRQGSKEMTAGNYAKAEELFRRFALEFPSQRLAPQAREEAKFCDLMQEAQEGGLDRPALVRLCEAFLAEYAQSAHAGQVKETIQQALYDEGQSIREEGKKTRSVARLENALPFIEKIPGVNPHGQIVPQAEALADAVRKDIQTIRDEDAFAVVKKALLGKCDAWLGQRRFAALRAEIAGITAKFPFGAQDADVRSLLNVIREKELAASSFVPARGQPAHEKGTPTARAQPGPGGETFILLQRQAGGRREGSPPAPAKGLEGEVVFLLVKGRCLALDAATGEYRWTTEIGSTAPVLPAIIRNAKTGRPEGALISEPAEGTLRLVSVGDGAPKWTYGSRTPFVVSPLVLQSAIYLPTLNDGIHVLNAGDGRLEGKYWFDGEIRNPPVYDEEHGLLYVLPENGCIYAVSLAERACKQIVSEAFEPYRTPCSAVLVGQYLLLVEYQGLKKMRLKIFSRDEAGLNLRAIRVGEFDIGENVGCRPVVSGGSLYSLTETGRLKFHGVNVRSEEAPLYPAAEEWPFTSLTGDYSLLLDTEPSPFKKAMGIQNVVLACGNGLAVYRFDAPSRKAEELWRFPPGGANEKVIPGEAYLPPQRVGNLVCISTIAPERDGAVLSAVDMEQKDMAWQVVAGAAAGTPVVDEAGGRVFVRNALGSVYAITIAGEDKPPKALDKLLIAGNVAGDQPVPAPYYALLKGDAPPGRLYLGMADNALHCVGAGTGAALPGWEEPFKTQYPCGPLAPFGGDALVFGTTQGGVFVAPLAGATTYCQEFHDPARSSCAVAPLLGQDGSVYIGSSRGVFYKLAMAERSGQRYMKVGAKFKASGPIKAGAAMAGEMVFVGDAGGTVYALSAGALERAGEWPLGAPITCDLAADGDRIFAASEAGCMYAISSQAKAPLWRFPKEGFAAAVKGRPLVLGRYVVIGTEDGRVYALRRETGEAAWTCDVGSGISAALAVMGRRLAPNGTGSGLVVPCVDGTVRIVALPKEIPAR